ncbi:probable E3 ubiquitin-protein ligase BAH1-like 1 [Phragmites australis]|uniref:probable E3 ubiquitin-protein ligase BAH1-like 1 n=1 Tax=Phragmites australis TaxID=29695 RepID=UPI002D77257D|nr:probable E3 ubiquitin-protein ligase BAH1-like 1 [Phragmites australis]XP_062211949.1 probable E3 ubiquitin-protein ligase BAH1-like 1 [Phragmites australis]XP_062211950.1 probable E3 ubiquitin-protein ligase BAH1-like 1 [Phragmites australis]
MKFGATYEEYLRAEQDKYLGKCSHVEYKRLKKVLKRCQVGRSLQADGADGDEQLEDNDESSEVCECNSCTLCDQMFFTELTKEASEIAGCFSSRVKRLLHIHVHSGLQRYIWRVRQCFIDDQQIMVQEGRLLLNYVTMNAIAIRKILKKYDKIHGSVSGRDFKSKMQTEHIELLQSPWLIELGAFHLNCDDTDADEPGGFFKNGFFKNFSCDLTGAQPLLAMTISETLKYEYSLTCPVCLDTLFNPYALGCGHLFCKACACGAASVYIFQGVKSAPLEAKCPVCRAVGVFGHAVHMTELELLLKTRDKDYWRQRLREERTEMVKQSKEYWDSQAMLSMGI